MNRSNSSTEYITILPIQVTGGLQGSPLLLQLLRVKTLTARNGAASFPAYSGFVRVPEALGLCQVARRRASNPVAEFLFLQSGNSRTLFIKETYERDNFRIVGLRILWEGVHV